jgi:hypothetical protein
MIASIKGVPAVFAAGKHRFSDKLNRRQDRRRSALTNEFAGKLRARLETDYLTL